MSTTTARRVQLIISILAVFFGLFFILENRLFSDFASRTKFVFGFVLLTMVIYGFVFQISFQYKNPLRYAWPEIIGIPLMLFAVAFLIVRFNSFFPPAVTPPLDSVIFSLSAGKIQSDLANLQPNSNVAVILVSGQEVQFYNATLLDVQGEENEVLAPPFNNKNAVTVRIYLKRSQNDANVLEFTNQLVSANAIFLLPSAPATATPLPTPASIKPDPTFVLSGDKIQSDLSNLYPLEKVAMLLVTAHQVNRYDVIVNQVQTISGMLTSTPFVNGKAIVHFSLINGANDATIIDFVRQLSDASAIYLLPT